MARKNEPVVTLADLIHEYQDKTGDSYSAIARRTGLSKAKIGQLARPENTYLVRQETLAKLATGLRLPLTTVQRASLGTAGFSDNDIQRNDSVRAITERLTDLPDSTLSLISDIIDSVAQHSPAKR